MAGIDERVATLEGRVHEQVIRMADFRDGIGDVRQSVIDLRADTARMGDELRGEIGSLRAEMGSLRAGMGSLRAEMHHEIGALRTEMHREIGVLREEMDRRFDRMDQKYLWLVGIVVTSGLATIGTVAGAFFSLLQAIQQHA